MTETQPPEPGYEEWMVRLEELRSRVIILATLKNERMQQSLRSFLEERTAENLGKILEEMFRDGVENGQITADLAWISSMNKVGLSPQWMNSIWDLKDEEQRDMNQRRDESLSG